MSHNLTVQVLDSDGDPVEGTEVTIQIEGIFPGGNLEEFTDDDGMAYFETAGDYEDSRKLKIFAQGGSFGPYYIDGGSYTVTLGGGDDDGDDDDD